MSTPFAQRVLDSLGEAFRARAGVLLADIVDALTEPAANVDALLRPGATGVSPFYDLAASTAPGFLGQLVGTTVPAGLTAQNQRAYVRQRSRWQRGTPAAITAAAAARLTGYRRVDLYERDTSPWHFTVRVYAGQVPPGVTAEVIAADLAAQKPVGLLMTVQVAAGASFDHMRVTHGPTLNDYRAAFPTLDAARTHTPEEGSAR